MKKIVSLLICLSFSLQIFASKVDTLVVHSESMNKEIKNVVILPDSYSKEGKALSVVYLLHGAGGDYKAWLGKAPNIKALADLHNVIIVCPDGEAKSWYFDSPIDETYKYETYISTELIAGVDKNYNTIASHKNRAITGYSMGGHGALYLAFKHTDVWGVAASMSGGVDIRPYALKWGIPDRLGNYSEYPEHWEKNSVINLVHLLGDKKLKFLFDCGVDDFFYEDNKRLHEKLIERKIPHDYIERPGRHDGPYWSNSIIYQMLFFKEFFTQKTK